MTLEELEGKVRKEQRKESRKQKNRRLVIWLLAGCLILAAGIFFLRRGGPLRPQESTEEVWTGAAPEDGIRARISVIDVGQGSAMLIVSGGEAMLVDGGGAKASSRTVTHLKAQGVTRLKYLVATHYDADHLYGAVGALEAFPVETVLLPDYTSDTAVYAAFRQHLEGKDAVILYPEPGESFTLGYCRFTMLAPSSREYPAENDHSLAFRLTDGAHSLLCTGDAEYASETEMLSHNKGTRRLASDVYIVGHHGSLSSTSAAFLAAVSPKWAVISCGENNEYGHPKAAVLDRLQAAGAALYRTDRQGDILFNFSDDGILWEQEPCNDFTPGQGG